MGSVSDFIDDENIHELQLGSYMNWHFTENQKKGSCYDFISPDGSKIEAKFDWDSIKTGNHYLEIAQTNDDKITWVPSGFTLSLKEAEFWVVINEQWIRIYQTKVLQNFIQENRSKLRIKQTRSRINFNQKGQFSKGYIIPFEELDTIVFSKFSNPIRRKSK